MDLENLKEALDGNELGVHHVSAAEVSNIMSYVNVSLEMDRTTLDYYYSIDVKSLLSSEMPISDLDDLKKEGWAFSKDGKELIVYL